MKKILVLVACLIPLLSFGQAKIFPVEYFGSLPDVSTVRLSPNGYQLAAIIRVDVGDMKGTAIQVIDLQSNQKKMVLFTDNKTFDITGMSWKGDSTLLVNVMYSELRKTGFGNLKTREHRMLVVDVANNKNNPVFSKAFISKYEFPPINQNMLVDELEDDPDHIYMSIPMGRLKIDAQYPSVIEVNIKNQSTKLIQSQMDNVYQWITDRQHRVRVALSYKDGVNKILVKDVDKNNWQTLWQFKEFSGDEVDVLGFGFDPNILYIGAYLEGRKAIYKVNLTDPDLKRELIISNPNYDVGGFLVYSNTKQDVVGIYDSSRNKTTYFDASLKKLQIGIDKAMPKSKNFMVGMSDDLQRYLIVSFSDVDPGVYLVGDRKKGSLDVVAYRYKNLNAEDMAEKKSYKYKARDGLEIEAFLSLPKGGEPKNLPTILLPHGGPISSDDDEFDYWTQFLVNRGYAVLQMNYRGSSGRGLDFRNAGLKNWGLQMQDDIEDGGRSLIKDGIADANSIGIVGASYGGYAALEGIVKTPDFFKCAVSVAGISDVTELVRDNRAFWSSYNVVDDQIGRDADHLKEISPVHHVDKIKVPVLLIHGNVDRQVDVKQSQFMEKAMKRAGKNVTYIELPDEDHFLTDNANRVNTFKAIDEFLAKYLPVKH